MSKPNVYVVQQRFARQPDGGQRYHNYDSAFAYGVVTYLVPPKNVVNDLYDGDVDRLFKERLSSFSSEDFLILTGDAVLCAQAVLHAISRLSDDVDHLNILKWNHEGNSYHPVEIRIPF